MIDKKKKKKRNNTANGPFAWVCFDDETNDKKQIQVMFLIVNALILVLKNEPTRKLTKRQMYSNYLISFRHISASVGSPGTE